MDDLLNTAPCGFLSFSDDGKILLVNQRLVTVLETTKEALEGQHIETIFSVGARVFYHTHFFPLLKMQGTAEEVYFSLRSKSGADVPVLVNAARHERDGKTVNDCIFVRMRQRHRYEEELLRARKQADIASAAKAKFLSMMSHDLRTPLQAISGYADLALLELGPDREGLREYLNAIKSAGREMLRLINDILGFAQLESGHVEVRTTSVPVREAFARAEVLMRLRLEESQLSYERRDCPEDVCVAADPDRLQQVLLNLLTNAAKFTPAGGSIWTSCDRNEGSVRIHVSDTGVGIPSDQIARIFEPFAQVDAAAAFSRQQGVGLGLAISRELARAMGGELSVTSEPGKGSTFTRTLDAAST